jgi:prepilin-type N-terminal cleavage/methylation domain-containing protein
VPLWAEGQPQAGLRGFTLIELLLVVAILSAVAMAAFGVAMEDRGETRREDTLNRLTLLRRATLGMETPAYGGEMRLSGFVADNGRLPESVRELAYNLETGNPDKLVEKAAQNPVYSKSIDSDCKQTGDNELEPSDFPAAAMHTALLLKGYRGGGYLAGMTRNGIFRDGWGNVAPNVAPDYEDNKNFGWRFSKPDSDSLVFISNGADNRNDSEGLSDGLLEADQSLTPIVKEDWKVSLAGWQVLVKNNTGSPVDLSDFSIALLVFRNNDTSGEWLRFTSENGNDYCPIYDPDDPATHSPCFLSFDTTVKCGSGTRASEIPIGRHLLVLLKGNNIHENSGKPVFAQVSFYPGASRPVVTLEIR